MNSPGSSTNRQGVLRDKIKLHRDWYFVEYQPADARSSFALLLLTVLSEPTDLESVASAAESELQYWLQRYPVPIMLYALDAKGDPLHFPGRGDESHLMGFVVQQTGMINRRWGLFENDELPAEQMEADYLAHAYDGIPTRMQKDVRTEAMRKAQVEGRLFRTIIFFVVIVPVLIEIISLGIDWLGYLLAAGSIVVGLYKAAKILGWLQPTQREKEKSERNLRMNHYFYHCERNPEGFNRLMIENFKQDAIEQTRKEAEALLKNPE
jgi:hypothetical protein